MTESLIITGAIFIFAIIIISKGIKIAETEPELINIQPTFSLDYGVGIFSYPSLVKKKNPS